MPLIELVADRAMAALCAEAVGLMGRLHPALESQLGIDQEVFLFEIRQDSLQQAKIPEFTAFWRDFKRICREFKDASTPPL